MRRPPFAIPMLLLVTGCASGLDSAVFMSAPPQPADAEVRIYRTQLPPCPYDELGLITWTPTRPWHKLQTGTDQLRDRARQMGGHAVVGFSIGERIDRSTSVSVDSAGVSFGSNENSRGTLSGTVVRFRDGHCDSR